MYLLNRTVAVIKPRQPFLDWANSLPNSTPVTLEELRSDPSAILIPDFDYRKDSEAFLRSRYAPIFIMELDSWDQNRKLWPAKQDYPTFKEWFDVEFCSLVVDTLDEVILKVALDTSSARKRA